MFNTTTINKTIFKQHCCWFGVIHNSKFRIDIRFIAAIISTVSPVVPDTVTKYVINDTNNVINVDATYQYGTTTSRVFDSETKKVVSESTSTYNLTTSKRFRALNDAAYKYDVYGNLIQVTGITYEDGLIKDDGTITISPQDKNSNIIYSLDDSKNYNIYPVKTTTKNIIDCDGNPLMNASGEIVDDIVTSSSYNMFGQALTTTNGNGFVTQYLYNNTGDIIKVTNPDGTTLSYSYDYSNNFATITNPNGTGCMSKYDAFGNLTDVYRLNSDSSSYCLVTHYSYDNYMRQTSEINYLEADRSKFNIKTYTYDLLGNITDVTVKDQNNSVLSKTSTNYAQAIVNNGNISDSTTLTVSTGQIVNDVSTDNISTVYTDGAGKTISTKTDVLTGNIGSYTNNIYYSGYNTTTSVSGETVETAEYYYNDNGNIKSTYYGTNGSSDYSSYSGSKIQDSTTYNGEGSPTQQTSSNINYENDYADSNVGIKYFYDVIGRTIEVDTPFDKDSSGNIIYSKEKTYYDAGGRVVEKKQTNNAIGESDTYTTVKYKYDNMGRVIEQEQVVNSTQSEYTQYYYDALGNLKRVYSQLFSPLEIVGLDMVTAGEDENYSVVKYDYDFQGRLISYTDALDNTETYQYYDITGLLNKKIQKNGNVITYTYDNSGNVIQVDGEQSGKDTISHSYSYDMAGNMLTAKETNVTTNTVNNDTTYTYDNMNRCLSEKYSVDGDLYKKVYTYDAGNVTAFEVYKNSETTPSYEEHYKYDSGNLFEITYGSDRRTFCQYGYDNNDNVKLVVIGKYTNLNDSPTDEFRQQDISLTWYSYNFANLKTDYTKSFYGYWQVQGPCGFPGHSAEVEKYEYSLNGNLISKSLEKDVWEDFIHERESTPVDYTEYSYDGINRLTGELYGKYSETTKKNQWQKQYIFDTNRTYSNGYQNTLTYTDFDNSVNNTVTTNTYNKANQIQEQLIANFNNSETLNNYNFTYDLSGNLLNKSDNGKTTSTYTYDSLNRMLNTTLADGKTTSYQYNAIDQRLSKATNGAKTTSVWNGSNIVVDYKASNGKTSQNSYIQGNQGQVIDGVLYANSVNGQGDVTASAQFCNESYASYNKYDAYGNIIGNPTNLTPLAYRGQYYDAETELYYLQARYYDSTIQQFTQEDTYWGDGTNLFAYCGSNPV